MYHFIQQVRISWLRENYTAELIIKLPSQVLTSDEMASLMVQ